MTTYTSGEWNPLESLVVAAYEGRSGPNRFEECFSIGIGLQSVDELSIPRKRLLTETEALTVKRVEYLLNEGAKALAIQLRIVDRHFVAVRSEIQKNANQFHNELYWIKHYTGIVEQEWTRVRVDSVWGSQPPSYSSYKYQPLYERTANQIKTYVLNSIAEKPDSTNLIQDQDTSELREKVKHEMAEKDDSSEKEENDNSNGKGLLGELHALLGALWGELVSLMTCSGMGWCLILLALSLVSNLFLIRRLKK